MAEAPAVGGGLQGRLARWRRSDLARRLFRHRSFALGTAMFAIVVLLALTADLVAPYDPNKNDYRQLLAAPSAAHLLGTDGFGRDILSRVIHGTRVSLRIGLMVVVATGVLGALIGAIAGYVHVLDNPIMRVMDGLMAFPGVLLAIALAAALGPSEFNATIALTVTFTPRTARVVRASVLVVREMEYVAAAVAAGAGH
ncbi:MAG: ABC transporter permease, partial [Nitrospirota bacterium]|nr:ABC transporter permease [Nitrospirota bacterium]